MHSGFRKEYVIIPVLAALLFLPVFSCLQAHSRHASRGRHYGWGRSYDLKQVGLALLMYESDHGTLPPTLLALLGSGPRDEYLPPKLLACAGDLHPENTGDGAWALDTYHYLYEGGARLADVPAGAPLVVYPFASSGGVVRYTIVRKDGRVEMLDEDAFLRLFAESATAVVEAPHGR